MDKLTKELIERYGFVNGSLPQKSLQYLEWDDGFSFNINGYRTPHMKYVHHFLSILTIYNVLGVYKFPE